MQLQRLCVLSVLLCSSAVLAQEGFPKPAEQLKKFEPMIGTWEGSGQVRHGPGGDQEKWTSKSSARWVLGGHFVREDLRVEMASMQDPLEMLHLYGWDRENGRYVSIEVTNLGEATLSELHWTPEGKMVSASQSVMMGIPMVDRWVSEFAGDGVVRFTGHQAQGDGDFYEHVSGEMRRTSKTPSDIEIADAAFMPAAVASAQTQLKRLKPVIGEYKLSGWWMPAPGAPKMNFTGYETVRPIFDGCVIEMVSKGDPMPDMPDAPTYEGIGWMCWDAHAKCYKNCYANNMGEISSVECRMADGKLIGTAAMVHQGQPACMRGVTEMDENGFTKHIGHMLTGSHPPMVMFEATYEKQ